MYRYQESAVFYELLYSCRKETPLQRHCYYVTYNTKPLKLRGFQWLMEGQGKHTISAMGTASVFYVSTFVSYVKIVALGINKLLYFCLVQVPIQKNFQ